MVKEFDIIIIGAGSAGLNLVSFTNKVGLKTVLIDRKDKNIGGDCLNYGCVPSKALIHIARLVHSAKESEKFGLKVSGKVDIKKVVKYIKDKQGVIRKHENASYFRKKGITVALGEARFVGKNEVKVGNKVYKGKKIIIATGSRPRELKVPGVEKVKVYNNESVFDLSNLPKRLLVVGGGPIGIEIGQALQRLGSQVTIIQRGAVFLPREDPAISKVLHNQLVKDGVKIMLWSEPEKFTSKNSVVIKHEKGKRTKVNFDAVLVAIGRKLSIENLGIEDAGIKYNMDQSMIKVDDYLRTTNKNVYLSGDVAGSYLFTHVTEMHAAILINNLFSKFKKKVNYDHIAWVTFTQPEIATYGLNEMQLKERKIPYKKLELNSTEDDRAIVDSASDGKAIMFLSKDDKILGGSIVAPNAGEIIQELILANTSKLNIKELFNKIYPYPTASRMNRRMIKKYMVKKRLTPKEKKALKFFYSKF